MSFKACVRNLSALLTPGQISRDYRSKKIILRSTAIIHKEYTLIYRDDTVDQQRSCIYLKMMDLRISCIDL